MSKVVLNTENGIAAVSIDRPEALNALSREIIDEIDGIVSALRDDPSVRCMIIHSDKNFAAGADIKGMADCSVAEAKDFSFTPTYDKIESLPFPTIAAIEGYALGGGMELALACDIRIAGESAKMGFPETGLGIFPGAGGTIRAPKLIGSGLAKELIFTGAVISSDRALSIGLVNQVVPDEEVGTSALKMAERIAKKGPVAIRSAKNVIDRGLAMPAVNDGTAYEGDEWAKLFDTFDQKEGMKAFMEKRKPVFQNR